MGYPFFCFIQGVSLRITCRGGPCAQADKCAQVHRRILNIRSLARLIFFISSSSPPLMSG